MSYARSLLVDAENQFTEGLSFRSQTYFSVTIWGVFAADAYLQASPDGGVTWVNVADGVFDAPQVVSVFNPDGNLLWRVGVPTGSFTSGEVNVRIGQ